MILGYHYYWKHPCHFLPVFNTLPEIFQPMPPVPLRPIDCCPAWHVAEKMTVVTSKYWEKNRSLVKENQVNKKQIINKWEAAFFSSGSSKKKIFFQTEISLYKVLRSATVSRSRVKTFPLPQNSTLWHPNPVGERSAGDTMGLGTSNGRLAVGVRSLLKRLLGRPAGGIFLRESHMLKPKKLTTHRHDQLEDSHLDMCWTLWWTASSFNKKLQSFLRLEKKNK